jgi:hypothetical protein
MSIFRKYKISLALVLSIFSSSLQAQFTYRFQINIEGIVSKQDDRINLSKGSVNYFENTIRHGIGTSIGISYRLKKIPLFLNVKITRETFRVFKYSSDINVNEEDQKLLLNGIGSSLRYEFFNKSTFRPYLFLGIGYNNLNLERRNITYSYRTESEQVYTMEDPIVWQYNLVQAKINSIGYFGGIGLSFRASDRIGIYFNTNLDYIPQDKSSWLSNRVIIPSYSLGCYVRLCKRKNNLL